MSCWRTSLKACRTRASWRPPSAGPVRATTAAGALTRGRVGLGGRVLGRFAEGCARAVMAGTRRDDSARGWRPSLRSDRVSPPRAALPSPPLLLVIAAARSCGSRWGASPARCSRRTSTRSCTTSASTRRTARSTCSAATASWRSARQSKHRPVPRGCPPRCACCRLCWRKQGSQPAVESTLLLPLAARRWQADRQRASESKDGEADKEADKEKEKDEEEKP